MPGLDCLRTVDGVEGNLAVNAGLRAKHLLAELVWANDKLWIRFSADYKASAVLQPQDCTIGVLEANAAPGAPRQIAVRDQGKGWQVAATYKDSLGTEHVRHIRGPPASFMVAMMGLDIDQPIPWGTIPASFVTLRDWLECARNVLPRIRRYALIADIARGSQPYAKTFAGNMTGFFRNFANEVNDGREKPEDFDRCMKHFMAWSPAWRVRETCNAVLAMMDGPVAEDASIKLQEVAGAVKAVAIDGANISLALGAPAGSNPDGSTLIRPNLQALEELHDAFEKSGYHCYVLFDSRYVARHRHEFPEIGEKLQAKIRNRAWYQTFGGTQADDVLLAWADQQHAYVVSNDRFRQHEESYPWLRETPARRVLCHPGPDGFYQLTQATLTKAAPVGKPRPAPEHRKRLVETRSLQAAIRALEDEKALLEAEPWAAAQLRVEVAIGTHKSAIKDIMLEAAGDVTPEKRQELLSRLEPHREALAKHNRDMQQIFEDHNPAIQHHAELVHKVQALRKQLREKRAEANQAAVQKESSVSLAPELLADEGNKTLLTTPAATAEPGPPVPMTEKPPAKVRKRVKAEKPVVKKPISKKTSAAAISRLAQSGRLRKRRVR